MSVGALSQKNCRLKIKVLAAIATQWSVYWFLYCVLIEISTPIRSLYFSFLFFFIAAICDEVSASFLRKVGATNLGFWRRWWGCLKLLGSVGFASPLLQQHNPTPEAAPCADSYSRYPWLSGASSGNDGIRRAPPYCFHRLLCVAIGFLRSAWHETPKKWDGESCLIHLRPAVGWQTCQRLWIGLGFPPLCMSVLGRVLGSFCIFTHWNAYIAFFYVWGFLPLSLSIGRAPQDT